MTLAAALLLGAVSVCVWFLAEGARPAARVHLRFASVLFAALATARLAGAPLGDEVGLLVIAIALPVLALAVRAGFESPTPPLWATVLLAAASICGLAGAATGMIAFAVAPVVFSAAAIIAVCVRRFGGARLPAFQGILSALAFLAAMSSFARNGAAAPCLLFSATALLGLTIAVSRASNLAVEEKRRRNVRRNAIIGGVR